MGRRVRIIGDRLLAPGRHRVRVEMGAFPAGVYNVRLQIGEQVTTRRVVKG